MLILIRYVMSKESINNRLQDITNSIEMKNLELDQAETEDSKKLIRNQFLILQNQMTLERIKLKIQQLRDNRPS